MLWRDSSVDGLKTGYTDEAGYCLVASSKRRGMRLISVVLGANSDDSRTRQTQKLFSYGFRHFDTLRVYAAGESIKENVPVWYGQDNFVNLVVADDITLTLPKGQQKNLQTIVVVDSNIEAPVYAGRELGRLKVSLDDEIIVNAALVADKDIPQAGLFSRFFDWILLFFTQLLS